MSVPLSSPFWMRTVLVVAAATSGIKAVAQEEPQEPVAPLPKPVKPMAAADFAKNRVSFKRGPEGRVRVVVWRGIQVPFPRPVMDCEVGLVADGSALIILAGGVRDDLGLYLVPKEGGFQKHATTGRRLPARFNRAGGPWPVVEGRHLVLFSYEKDGGIEIRALDFAGRVLAQKRVAAAVESWSAGYREATGMVELDFGAAAKLLEFRHPLAPHLQVEGGGLLKFGRVNVGATKRQTVDLRNTGKRTLSLRCGPLQEGFHLVTKAPKQLVAGGVARLVVEFRPLAGKSVEWTWKLPATGVNFEQVLVLRGEGVAPIAAPKPEVKATPANPARPKGEPPPTPKPAPAAVASPRVLHFACFPRRAGAARIAGRLALPAAPELMLQVGKQTVAVPVDRAGRFMARVEAAPGTNLMIRAVSGDLRSPFVTLGTVQPMLASERGVLIVRCRPDEAFQLTAYLDGVVLRTWRGVTNRRGERRLPRSILGPPHRGTKIELRVSVVEGGRSQQSAPLQIQ